MTADDRLRVLRDLIQQDVGNRGLARDPHANLLTACPDDFAAACRSVAAAPQPALAVVTGFYIAHADPPAAETDGPPGALFLARALTPLGVRVTLVTDSFCRQALEVGLEAAGLAGAVPVITLPPSTDDWPTFLDREWQPFTREGVPLTHLVAVERVGLSHDGPCRNMRGLDITAHTAPAHLLFEDAARRAPPLPTIGIGDGGNEIGMGKIDRDVLHRNVPDGRLIACRVPADYLIVAGVSNWGAYALAAGVRLLRGAAHDPALFDAGRERALLRVMVERGPLVDGRSGRREATVDGVPWAPYAAVLERLGELAAV
jgi:hypothetical protein